MKLQFHLKYELEINQQKNNFYYYFSLSHFLSFSLARSLAHYSLNINIYF